MNPELELLHPYPFEKLAQLKDSVTPPSQLEHIALSIGEPKHAPPAFVLEELSNQLGKVAFYAGTKGTPELRQTISQWARRRFKLNLLDADSCILPVNGTREAIFAFVQAALDRSQPNPLVLMPNPFYQIYEGAALLAGAKPVFLNSVADNNFAPDFDSISDTTWNDCQILFLCTPGNPTGNVLPFEILEKLIALADKHDFIIACDECYSELYFDESNAPIGLLEACARLGRDDFARCVVFHSLSKRSNLPGLRSGFIAGDTNCIQKFLLYRTYHGSAMSLHTQMASIAAWSDETHVVANRDQYREKFKRVMSVLDGTLDVSMPEASFYLWVKTPVNDEVFAQSLFEHQNITVLPGSYLARDTDAGNPGTQRVRMALVASLDKCIEAAERIKYFVTHQLNP